jgi:hypothetical protein
VLVGAGPVRHDRGGLGSGVAEEVPARVERVGHSRGGSGWVRGQVWPGWRRPGRLGSGTVGMGSGAAVA